MIKHMIKPLFYAYFIERPQPFKAIQFLSYNYSDPLNPFPGSLFTVFWMFVALKLSFALSICLYYPFDRCNNMYSKQPWLYHRCGRKNKLIAQISCCHTNLNWQQRRQRLLDELLVECPSACPDSSSTFPSSPASVPSVLATLDSSVIVATVINEQMMLWKCWNISEHFLDDANGTKRLQFHSIKAEITF